MSEILPWTCIWVLGKFKLVSLSICPRFWRLYKQVGKAWTLKCHLPPVARPCEDLWWPLLFQQLAFTILLNRLKASPRAIPGGCSTAPQPWPMGTDGTSGPLGTSRPFPARFTHQGPVQQSRACRGSLPGSTAEQEHCASKKTQSPAGIIWGTNTQPWGCASGTGVTHWHSPWGRHGASIRYTKAIAASELAKEKIRKKIWKRKKARGSAKMWRKFQGNTWPVSQLQALEGIQIFSILCLLP